jgi:hypothetical protein
VTVLVSNIFRTTGRYQPIPRVGRVITGMVRKIHGTGLRCRYLKCCAELFERDRFVTDK